MPSSPPPVCGKRASVFLHRCYQTSLLPKANKSHSNKEEGLNNYEKELAVADHVLIDAVSSNANGAYRQHNARLTTLSSANLCGDGATNVDCRGRPTPTRRNVSGKTACLYS